MAGHKTPWMGPIPYRCCVWKARSYASLVVDHVAAQEERVPVIKLIVKTRGMRVQRHRSFGIEPKAGGVQLCRQSTITHCEVVGWVLGCSLCQGCERQRIDSYSVATGRKNCLQLGGS